MVLSSAIAQKRIPGKSTGMCKEYLCQASTKCSGVKNNHELFYFHSFPVFTSGRMLKAKGVGGVGVTTGDIVGVVGPQEEQVREQTSLTCFPLWYHSFTFFP